MPRRVREQRTYIGIDPGLSGAVVTICRGAEMMRIDGQFSVRVQSVVTCIKGNETESDVAGFLRTISEEMAYAMIESVHSLPKQGIASSFKFGRSYGFLRGLLVALKIPFEEVSPQRWQKAMGCLSRGDKNVTKARAQQLFPQEKITHATADALLIALYCKRKNEGTL